MPDAERRLVEDTAWHPVMKEEVQEWGNGTKGAIFKFFLGTPLKLWASVGHWALWHFDINKFTQKQKPRVSRAFRCFLLISGVLLALDHYTAEVVG